MKYLSVRWILLLGLMLASCGSPIASLPTGTATPPLPTAGIRRPTPTQVSPPSPTPMPSPTPAPSPTATPAPQPWRFVVLGDTRTEGLRPPDTTAAIVARAAQAQPEVVLADGDMINALDTQDQVREQWRLWRAAVAPLGARHVLVSPGNHDVQGHAWATDLLAEAFPELPTNGPAGFERRAYALDYRGVRFISIDSESFSEPHRLGQAQLDWLEQQLRDNPNLYTIVFSHDPAYPIGPHIGSSLDAYPQERDRLWQLLHDYQVSAYIAGHEHLYNRREIEGVTQIIAGTSGSFIYTGYGGEFYHYLVGEVSVGGLTIVAYDLEGAERDRVTLR
jgi:3',5'-cyclic AMP phosphodiesterase CpdA